MWTKLEDNNAAMLLILYATLSSQTSCKHCSRDPLASTHPPLIPCLSLLTYDIWDWALQDDACAKWEAARGEQGASG